MLSETEARSLSPTIVPRVLFLEADRDTARALSVALKQNFVVETASTAEVALERVRSDTYDAILLDAADPSSNGLEICHKLRKIDSRTPILMLVAPDGFDQRVAALDAGAHDYLSRTAPIDELSARLRTIMERAARVGLLIFRASGIELNVEAHTVTVDGESVDLSPREFALLQLFMSNPDRALNRDEILDQVWDFAYKSNVVDVYVRYLRDKIDEAVFETVRGLGYRFSPSRRTRPRHIDLTDEASHPSVITP